jgi:hypothetical protein
MSFAVETTERPVSPRRRLDAQIRLARHALDKAEGRWLADLSAKRAVKLNRRRDELSDLVAQRQALGVAAGGALDALVQRSHYLEIR